MKKLILTSAFAFAVTGAALAQGELNWGSISFADFTAVTNTTQTSPITGLGTGAALVNGSSGKTAAAAGAYYYELLYSLGGSQVAAPTTLAGLASWSDTTLEGVDNSATAGRAVPTVAGDSEGTVPFTTSASIILVGWSSNLGTTWATALSILESPNALASVSGTALFGETSSGFVTPLANGTSPGAAVFGSPGIVDLNTPLYVVSTPEPTTIALGVVGGLSLLALRRKNA
jgi:hypothetical protein